MTVDDYNIALLAEIAWRVGGKVSLSACEAVLFCIRNRVEKAGDNNWLKAMGEDTDTRDPMFADVLKIAEQIYTGERVDIKSNNGLFWEESEGRERVAVIGPDFILYK